MMSIMDVDVGVYVCVELVIKEYLAPACGVLFF
jgi:hypothetical protein